MKPWTHYELAWSLMDIAAATQIAATHAAWAEYSDSDRLKLAERLRRVADDVERPVEDPATPPRSEEHLSAWREVTDALFVIHELTTNRSIALLQRPRDVPELRKLLMNFAMRLVEAGKLAAGNADALEGIDT